MIKSDVLQIKLGTCKVGNEIETKHDTKRNKSIQTKPNKTKPKIKTNKIYETNEMELNKTKQNLKLIMNLVK